MKPISVMKILKEAEQKRYYYIDKFQDELVKAIQGAGYRVESEGPQEGIHYLTVFDNLDNAIRIDLYEAGNNPADFEVDTIGIGGDSPEGHNVDVVYKSGWDVEDGAPSPLHHEPGELVWVVFKEISKTSVNEVLDIINESFNRAGEEVNESNLKESDGFSGTSFEKNIPHGMRFKEYDFVDNGETLYWVTQEPFSKEQLNQFAEAFYKTGIPHAAVTVRDFSTYDYDDDNKRNVLAYIDATANKVDADGYWNEIVSNGWENDLTECDKKLKEADENDPTLDKTIKVYDIDALVDKEINADSEEKYEPHTLHKAAIITKKDGTGCVVDYEAVGSSFDSIDDDITVSLSPKTEDENGKRSIYIMPTAQVKVKVSDLLKAPHEEMKARDFFTKHNYNDRCEQNYKGIKPYLTESSKVVMKHKPIKK